MFDCGEGTQHQVLHAPVKLTRIEKIFITHMHGDHIFGLPGLLSSRSFQGSNEELHIYGPLGLKEFLTTALDMSQTHLTYPISFHEVIPGLVCEDGQFVVTCDELQHVIPCVGYRIVEKPKAGSLKTDLLTKLQVPQGPIYARLKAGETITLDNGLTLHGPDFLNPSIPGRTVTILGDTRPCEASIELASHADVLVHEATFHTGEGRHAHSYGHSTALDAATIAAKAAVTTLILTHISARYQSDAIRLLDEARAVHPNTFLAEDFWNFEVPSH